MDEYQKEYSREIKLQSITWVRSLIHIFLCFLQFGHIRFLVNMILYVDFVIEARNLNSIHEV